MKMIGIMGAKHAGKDTVGKMVIEADPSFRRVAFADVMKEMAVAIDPYVQENKPGRFTRLASLVSVAGWEEAKDHDDVRRFLQRLGTEGGRGCLGEDIWVNATWRRYVYPFSDPIGNDTTYDPDTSFVFTDVRFPNEIQSIRRAGGEIWRVERPDLVEDGDQHTSERAWRDEAPDVVIINDYTLADLRRKVYIALEVPIPV